MVSISFMITLFTFNVASGEDIYKNQGVIMSLDLKQKMMVINERTFFWDQSTIICNEKGNPIDIENFKPNARVYIEAVRDKKNNPMRIEKIYLLPKHIDNKEKHRYPFLQ